MQFGNAFLRLKALNHRETRERVLQHAGIALFLIGNVLFRDCRLVSQNHGDDDGQQGETDGNQRQQQAAPKHEAQRADKRDADLYRALKPPDKVRFDGVHVVGEGGEIERAVLAGEGLNAFFHQPVKNVFPILLHCLCAELREKCPVQNPSQSKQRKRASRNDQQRVEAVGAFSGDQIGDLLDEPGDHQLRRGAEQGSKHGHDKVESIFPEQLFDIWAPQRLDFFLAHRLSLLHRHQ